MQPSTSTLQASGFELAKRRAALAALRHRAAPALAWLATFCYAAWQLLIEQKLFLHPFSSSALATHACPSCRWAMAMCWP